MTVYRVRYAIINEQTGYVVYNSFSDTTETRREFISRQRREWSERCGVKFAKIKVMIKGVEKIG